LFGIDLNGNRNELEDIASHKISIVLNLPLSRSSERQYAARGNTGQLNSICVDPNCDEEIVMLDQKREGWFFRASQRPEAMIVIACAT
jgi:hypothetical protein